LTLGGLGLEGVIITWPIIIWPVKPFENVTAARTCLGAVGGAVEEADAADAVEDGVAAVLQHVVRANGRLALPLRGEDGPLHHGEVILVQHLGHVRQLPAKNKQ